MYKNLIFDLGGVVFDEGGEKSVNPLRQAARDSGQFQALWSNLLLGRLKMKDCIEILINENPENKTLLDGIDSYEFLSKNLPPIKETAELMKLLSKSYNVYVLSNATDAMRDYAVKYLEIPANIRGIFSCDVNMMKPDFNMFRLALNHFQLTASETIYFDDKPKNCAAAKFLGMESVVVKSTDDIRKALKL